MRHLLLQEPERLLADDLRCDVALGLGRHHVFVVEGLTVRHLVEKRFHQLINAFPRPGADGQDLRKDPVVRIRGHQRKQLLLRRLVDLVDEKDRTESGFQ